VRRVPQDLLGRPRLYEAWCYMRHNPSATASELGGAVGSRVSDGSRLARLLEQCDPDLRSPYWLPDGLNARQVGMVCTYNALVDLAHLYGTPTRTTIRNIALGTDLHRKVVARSLVRLRNEGYVLYHRVHGGIQVDAIVLPTA